MNDRIQDLINGLAGQSGIADHVMIFAAKDLILVAAVVLVALWFWPGSLSRRAANQRLVLAAAVSALVALAVGALIGHLHPEARPFVTDRTTHQLIGHAPDNGLPSDHALAGFAIGGTVVWWRRLVGGVLLAAALVVGFARVYVGIHWPGDILAGAAVGLAVGTLAAWTMPWWTGLQRWGCRFLPPRLVARP
jgi:undecaprenyl-diphosphatase